MGSALIKPPKIKSQEEINAEKNRVLKFCKFNHRFVPLLGDGVWGCIKCDALFDKNGQQTNAKKELKMKTKQQLAEEYEADLDDNEDGRYGFQELQDAYVAGYSTAELQSEKTYMPIIEQKNKIISLMDAELIKLGVNFDFDKTFKDDE